MARERTRGLLWLAAFVATLAGGTAWGHKLKVFVTAEGRTIRGSAYFRVGSPAMGAKVEVFDPAGRKLAETTTDEQGKFTVEARVRCDHRIVVTSGDGHGAQYLLEAAELPGDLPAAEGGAPPPSAEPAAPSTAKPPAPSAELEAAIERAVSKQVNPLREQLARSEERRTLLDVLGGIGYIVGIAGIVFYFLGAARKRRAGASPD